MGCKVLVCGASGFIGRNIAERLARRGDLEVYGTHFRRPGPAHPRIVPVQADLTDPQQVSEAVRGMDVVIQAAANTSGARDIVSQPYIHVTDNAVMNSLLLRSAFESGVKHFVFFSCSVMYQSAECPLAETDFDANADIWPSYFGIGWTKVYIEKMCEFYSRLASTRFTVIRHANIYGPHDKYDLDRSHVFGATVAKVMGNTDGVLTVWGPGTEKRDLLYVQDLVDFVETALSRQRSAFELVNVGSGLAVPVAELVAKIIELSGKKIAVEHDLSKPHIATQLCLDIAKAREQFGWAPKTTLVEGIAKTLAWYRENTPPPVPTI